MANNIDLRCKSIRKDGALMHKVGRNKAVSLLLVVAMVIGIIPFGALTAFAQIVFDGNVAATVEPVFAANSQTLGSITITPGSQAKLDKTVEVTLDFPQDDVNPTESPAVSVKAQVYSGAATSGSELTAVISTDTATGNLKAVITTAADGDKIVIKPIKVNLKDTATGDVNVNLSAKRTNDNGATVWTLAAQSVKIGTVATKSVTATAGTAPNISEGTGKSTAEISLTESGPAAIGDGATIDIELANTASFAFDGTTPTVSGTGLTVTGKTAKKLTLAKSGTTSSATTYKLTPTITVFPGAPTGDVKVNVSGSSSSNVTAATLTVAKVGAAAVTASVKDVSAAKDIYPATNSQQIEDIVLKSDSAITAGKTIVVALSAGKWTVNGSGNPVGTYSGLTAKGTFNDGKSAWFEVTANNALKEITMTGLQVNLPADAALGDLKATMSGTLGLTEVLNVSKVISRVNATSVKKNVKVGLSQAAGDIVIGETVKDSVANGTSIKLSLPTGVTFVGTPKMAVGSAEAATTGVVVATDKASITITPSLSDSSVETVTISAVSYDIDSRVASGDVKVELGGNALNKLAAPDDTKAVASVVNATVASATAKAAVFVIGQSSFTTDGTSVTMDVAPFIKASRTFVPVRFAAQALGVSDGNIIWDGVKKTVTLIKGDRVVQMTIGSKTMLINGAAVTMDVAPEIVAPGRTMLPVRFVAQGLGATVGWDAATKTVTLNTP